MKPKEKHIYEIFALVQDAESVADRIEILKVNSSFALRTVLQLGFGKVELDLPSGLPPFKEEKSPNGLQFGRFNNVIKNLKACVKGNNIPPVKKERIFINILEAIHPEDAKILVLAKDKEIKKNYGRITHSLVKKAFPNILP